MEKAEAIGEIAGRALSVLTDVLQAVLGHLSKHLPTPCVLWAVASSTARGRPMHHLLLSYAGEEWRKIATFVLPLGLAA